MTLATQATTGTAHTLTLEGIAYRLNLFGSASDPAFRDEEAQSIFQRAPFHLALESAPPEGMTFHYVRIDGPDGLVGLLTFQVERFNPGVSLANQVDGSLWSRIRYGMARWLDMEVLCLGNTLVTGDYGFLFAPSVPMNRQAQLMRQVVDWMLTLPRFDKVRMVFLKDFYEDIFRGLPGVPANVRYHPIDTQPNMILTVDPAWKNLEGYLDALKSKYRVRARKALSMASGLEMEELDLAAIESMQDHLHFLYKQVARDVGFNLFTLSPGYFAALKRHLGDDFRLWVYRENGQVISFFTVIEDGEWLDAHFLGYDPEINHRYRLYLNMLLTMIDLAARRGFRQLQLSRTATEIKCSVGARGVPMWAYLRHTKGWVNRWFPMIYRFFQPDLSWVPRDPFSEGAQAG